MKLQKALKRLLDILISLVCLVLLSPFLGVMALAIACESGFPVLFRQERVGKDGKTFTILKFRTMLQGAEKHPLGVFTSADDPRVTRVGRLLRRFSLDEFPQLINVLGGEISLVGPRPTLAYQVENYSERQRGRLRVKPGITGWAQVNGRKGLSWPERIELDLWYIEHWSLCLDLRILLRTPLIAFISRKGVDNLGVPMDEIARKGSGSVHDSPGDQGGGS
jgi:lipopolysaccharide/colanic/teichoic acid biosynthesis glycosyltransferase